MYFQRLSCKLSCLSLGVAVFVAGCGGGAGSAGPSQQAAQPVLPVSQTLTLLAGAEAVPGQSDPLVDGAGASARFSNIGGLAADTAGNVFVSDSSHCAVRKVTPAGVVSTLAGRGNCLYDGRPGMMDGTGADAGLQPGHIAVDASGNVYTEDASAIRKITPGGVVTTLAGGFARVNPAVDGTGAAASFEYISDIAATPDGQVLVADETFYDADLVGHGTINRCNVPDGYHSLRTVSQQGVVATVPGSSAHCDAAQQSTLTGAERIRYDHSGNLYLTHPAGIVRHGASGDVTLVAAGKSPNGQLPADIAPDDAGNLYYLTTSNQSSFSIFKVTPDGSQTEVFATRADAPADIRVDTPLSTVANLTFVRNHDFVFNTNGRIMRVTLK